MRPVDADELVMFPYSERSGTEDQIAEWIEQAGLSEDDTAERARELCWKIIEGCVNVVKTQPTLTQPNEAEKAIQRLGDFGKLFLDYSGCPRGPMGEPGGSTIEEWVTMMEPICDVDGGWWRPVPEKALQILLCEMRSLKQAVPPDHFPDSTKMVQGRPNEPLTCDGCKFEYEATDEAMCEQCIRSSAYRDYYRRPPEGEADD